AQNDEMELLRLYIEFERALESTLNLLTNSPSQRPGSVRQMWEQFKQVVKPPDKWDAVVRKVVPIRNEIAHGRSDRLNSEEVIEAYLELIDLTDWMKSCVKPTSVVGKTTISNAN